MKTTRMVMIFLAVLMLAFVVSSGVALAEEPLQIPLKARQSFEHQLDDFLASQKSVQALLKGFDDEAAKQFQAFSEAGSTEERNAASEAMDRAMLTKVGRLTQAFEEYNGKIKDLRTSVVAMANMATVQKTDVTLSPIQFDDAMASFEPIARELTRLGLGREASELHSLSSEIANKHRVRMANRARVQQHFSTGYISGLSEELHAIETKLMALTGTLKEMVQGIQQAHTARDVNRMRGKVAELKSLGGGLTSTYLGGYGNVLDYMMSSGEESGAAEETRTYEGQDFPRISQSNVSDRETPQ